MSLRFIHLRAGYLAALMALLSLGTPVCIQAETSLSEIQSALNEPVTVLLTNGNRQKGRVASWDQATLRLEVSMGGGVAELSYPKDEIREMVFPGSNYKSLLFDWTQTPERYEDALQLFRAYYVQRGAYFSLLPSHELFFFVRYAEFAIEQDKPLRAVAMIDAVRPYITDESIIRSLEDSLLLGLFNGGMRDEAIVKAREWIKEAQPAGSSALGWRLLAELHYENEDYESAYWTAMHPVAFSNQMPMAHLNVCYAFAILSAEELRIKEEPEKLAQEMTQRGLEWPTNVGILQDKRPEHLFIVVTVEEIDEETEDSLLEEEPLQTPSPVDPVESLPTRIYN